jgi:glycosyltransferase involved in cell wall biosynthesis
MLIPSFYPLIGGSETQVLLLSKALIELGVKVFVVTRKIDSCTKINDCIEGVLVKRLVYICKPYTFSISSLVWLIINHRNYDLIFIHTLDSPSLTACICKMILNKPIIIKIRGGGLEIGLLKKPLGSVRWRILRKYTDKFVALTSIAAKELMDHGISQDRIIKQPNGVIIPSSSELENHAPKYLAVSVGRIDPIKRPEILLEVWRMVVDSIPGAILLIIGDGPFYNTLQEKIINLGLNNNIIITGIIQNADVKKMLMDSEVFVHCSKSEGMSNAMLEAISHGLPIVCTRFPGVEEVVRHGYNGFICDPDNIEEIASELIRILCDNELRGYMGRNSRKISIEKYSIEHIAQHYKKEFQELL